MMVAAAIYVLCCKDTLWQQVAAVVAAVVTPAWAAHFALLRYTVDAQGITRRSLSGTTTITWAEGIDAQVQETR